MDSRASLSLFVIIVHFFSFRHSRAWHENLGVIIPCFFADTRIKFEYDRYGRCHLRSFFPFRHSRAWHTARRKVAGGKFSSDKQWNPMRQNDSSHRIVVGIGFIGFLDSRIKSENDRENMQILKQVQNDDIAVFLWIFRANPKMAV